MIRILPKTKIVLLALVALTVVACNDIKSFHQFYSIPHEGWSKTDSLIYEIKELPSPAELEIDIRFTSDYPYNDLYIGVRENLSDSLSFTTDTLHMELTFSDGRSKGGGIGKLYQLKARCKSIDNPQLSQDSQVQVYHLMTDSTLVGLEDIGVRINRVDDEHVLHQVVEKQTEE